MKTLFPENETDVQPGAGAAFGIDPAPVPRDPDALYAWAAHFGVKALLGVRVMEVEMRALDARARQALYRVSAARIRDVLLDAGDEKGPVSSLLSVADFTRLRESLEGAVLAQARKNGKLLDEEEKREAARTPPPSHPILRALVEALRQARVPIRQREFPPATSHVASVPARFQRTPPALVVDTAGEFSYHRVSVGLSVFPDGPLSIECQCNRRDCGAPLVAIERLLDVAHAPIVPAIKEMLSFLSTPGWRRALTAIEEEAGRVADPAETRLVFQLQDVDDSPHLVPYMQKRLKTGRWSGGQAHRKGHTPPDGTDDRARQALLLAGGGYGVDGENLFAALSVLAGSNLVYLAGEMDRPLEVRVARTQITVAREETGEDRVTSGEGNRFVLLPSLDGDPKTAASVRAQLKRGCVVYLDKNRTLCLVARVDKEFARVAAAVAKHPARFPPEAREALLAGVSVLERRVPVALPDELAGEHVAADLRPVLRLSPNDEGLLGEVRLRPLAELPSVVPGEGPDRLTALRGGRRVQVLRDRGEEPALARAALASLPPEGLEFAGAHAFRIAGADESFDLIAHLAARTDLDVEWPDEAGRRTFSGTASNVGLRVAIVEKNDWFGLSGDVAVGEDTVPLADVLDAVRRNRRYVAVTGSRFARISDELRISLMGAADVVFSGRGGLEASLSAAPALTDLLDRAGETKVSASWRTFAARLRDARDVVAPLPDGFTATLRPYQVDGYRWLARLASWGPGACLADDMGLGKTLQALALVCAKRTEGPALVVAPTSVCFNWIREAQRYAPGLRPLLFREEDRAKIIAEAGPGDLLVTSYGLLLRHAREFADRRFAVLILDEAQVIKNAATHRARAVRNLDAGFRLALSGTPVENHLGDLWSLMRSVTPGLLGSWEQFRERFAGPIENGRDPSRMAALAQVVRPFILRRTKDEVARELPPRTDIRRMVPLGPEQKKLYEAARLAIVAALTGRGEAPSPDQQRRFEVLAAITRLRQLACHPRLLDAASPAPSAKLEAFLELVDELRDGGHRALVFSQFTSHLALVEEALAARGTKWLYLDGRTPEAERRRRVDAFQAGEGELFLISLKAGGTGLNLTAANYVIHLDPWWNPAVEDQASDRAHRIGQQKPVTVYRLVSEGTIEVGILALHEKKRDLVAGLLAGSEAAAKLSTEELIDLIRAGASDKATRE